eukprot:140514_1
MMDHMDEFHDQASDPTTTNVVEVNIDESVVSANNIDHDHDIDPISIPLSERVVVLEKLTQDLSIENRVLKEAVSNLSRTTEEIQLLLSSQDFTQRRQRPTTAPSRSSSNKRVQGRREQVQSRHRKTRSLKASMLAGSDPASVTSTPRDSPLPTARRKGSNRSLPKGLSRDRTPCYGESPPQSARSEEIDQERKQMYYVGNQPQHVIAPSFFAESKEHLKPPDVELSLEYVYGYNGKDCRNNLFFADDGKRLIYNIAGTVVVFDPDSNVQKMFTGHNDDVTCIAVSPTSQFVASGQIDPKGAETPFVSVWNYETMDELCRISHAENIEHRVQCCAFGARSELVYCLDGDMDFSVWRGPWVSGAKLKCVATQSGSKSLILAMALNEHFQERSECVRGDSFQVVDEFLTLGKNHLKYWQMQKRKEGQLTLSGRLVSGMDGNSLSTTLCGRYFPNGNCLVGSSSGEVYVIRGNKMIACWTAHKGPVGAVEITKEGFVTADFDGFVRFWEVHDNSDTKFRAGPVGDGQLPVDPKLGARAITYSEKRGEVCIGTRACAVFAMDEMSKKVQTIVQGHHDDVWGVAVHPFQKQFVSVGYDGHVRLWDYGSHKSLKDVSYGKKVVAVQYSYSGEHLAIGFITGHLTIVHAETFEPLFDKEVAKEQISALCFSPDNSVLAVGSWDQCVYLLHWMDKKGTYKVGRPLTMNSSSITSIQWSEDGKIVCTNSKSYESLCFNAVTKRQIVRVDPDIRWRDWSNLLGWHVKGIFGKHDGAWVNSANVSEDQSMLVTGDDDGQVRVFRFPALHPDACKTYAYGHSSFVVNVAFTRDMTRVISCGSHDYAAIQWRVERAEVKGKAKAGLKVKDMFDKKSGETASKDVVHPKRRVMNMHFNKSEIGEKNEPRTSN